MEAPWRPRYAVQSSHLGAAVMEELDDAERRGGLARPRPPREHHELGLAGQ